MSSRAPPPPPPLCGLLESMIINDKNKIVRPEIARTECVDRHLINVHSGQNLAPMAVISRKVCSYDRKCEEHVVKRSDISDDKNAAIKRKLEALFGNNIQQEKPKVDRTINAARCDTVFEKTVIPASPIVASPNRGTLPNSPRLVERENRLSPICNISRSSVIEAKTVITDAKKHDAEISPVLRWNEPANKIDVLSLNDNRRREIPSLENRKSAVSVGNLHCEVDIGCTSAWECTEGLTECRLTPIPIKTQKITRPYCAVLKNNCESMNLSTPSDFGSRFHFKEVLVTP